MTNQTHVTQRDLKLFPSERLTDNDDGGGFPVYTPLSGADNELFNPVAPIDRVNGTWEARLVYGAVNCPDNSPLYGSYFAITKPPIDPDVSYFAIEANKFAEDRKSFVDNIEACRVPTSKTYFPTSENRAGENSFEIKDYSTPSQITIGVGDVLYMDASYLAKMSNSSALKKVKYGEFVKVAAVDIYDYQKTITQNGGNTSNTTQVTRFGCIVTTTKTFEYTYMLDYVLTKGYANIDELSFKHVVYESDVVDNYRAYAVKKLENTVAKDSKIIKIGGLTDKIAPFIDEIIEVSGIDTLKLDQSADTQVFKVKDTILISNHQSENIGSAHTGGQTVALPRTNLDRICVQDDTGKPVSAELWSFNLADGTITWSSNLSALSNYKKPIHVHHVQEELNRIKTADADGNLGLLFKTLHNYNENGTFVSSVMQKNSLKVRVSVPFTQRTWDYEWEDAPQGDSPLNNLNLTAYPMILSDEGAITERWLIKFISNTQFELYGEVYGYVDTFDTTTDLSPANPYYKNAHIPFFTILKEAFGNQAPWAMGDCIRFNTCGTLVMMWLVRVVHPNRNVQTDSDGFKICFHGATSEIV